MSSILRSRRWLVGHILALAACLLFVNLGFWQLRRLEDRRVENVVMAARMTSAPLPITELVDGAGTDVDSLEFRPATAIGVFRPDHEVLVRSQVHEGIAGFHVVTPLVLEDRRAVLVNRGWVPLEMDVAPVSARPPEGVLALTGLIRLTQTRARFGPSSDAGASRGPIARIDLDSLGETLPWELLPVYLIRTTGVSTELPVPLPAPITTDEGNHLVYAIQWFAFTAIGLVGYTLLLRRALGRTRTSRHLSQV
ncbi:MAG: SURF1 family protein [Actinomycetota bacterium]